MPETFDQQLARLRKIIHEGEHQQREQCHLGTPCFAALAELLRRWDAAQRLPMRPHEDDWHFTDEHGATWHLRRTGLRGSPLAICLVDTGTSSP